MILYDCECRIPNSFRHNSQQSQRHNAFLFSLKDFTAGVGYDRTEGLRLDCAFELPVFRNLSPSDESQQTTNGVKYGLSYLQRIGRAHHFSRLNESPSLFPKLGPDSVRFKNHNLARSKSMSFVDFSAQAGSSFGGGFKSTRFEDVKVVSTDDKEEYNFHGNGLNADEKGSRKEDSTAAVAPRVILYNEGATPLFLAIEDSQWHTAVEQLITTDGNGSKGNTGALQARTWVQSTGTKATTFEWSVWRRLPLHEACRRQAPAWLVSHLIRAYPGAASEVTQFGELPLHLAVECGAAPEVVHAVLVAYFPAIATQDRSGRTPLDVLRNVAELLTVEDYKVVYESLERAQLAWDQLQERHAADRQVMHELHQKELLQVKLQHEQELDGEAAVQADLLDQVQRLTLLLERLQEKTTTQHERIECLSTVESSWRQRVYELEKSLEEAHAATSASEDEVANLEKVIVENNHHIDSLEKDCYHLKVDLAGAHGLQHELVIQMAATEQDLHKLVEGYACFQDTLTRQYKDMRSVIRSCGAHEVDSSSSYLLRDSQASNSFVIHASSSSEQNEEKKLNDDGLIESHLSLPTLQKTN